jgi:hypothetical protein
MNLTKIAFLGCILTMSPCYAADYTNASNNAINAAYKQSGYATLVSAYADELQVRYVPLQAKESGAVVYFLYKAINDHSIGFKWSF